MSDRVVLKDLQVFARHGVRPEEKKLGQRFAVDVTAFMDLRPAGESDDYGRTVCYDALTRTVIDTLTAQRFYLIEAAAEAVAQTLLTTFPLIDRVMVEVRKPAAAIDAVFEHVGVVIERARRA
ncbi:MAG TPA: dihydroneopterin aldolase [Beijerinckiaceae bacterium]|nr:dihydroneopterin aldolase [Beijerinckiaceae bacterium]